jgi:hypothetical protein
LNRRLFSAFVFVGGLILLLGTLASSLAQPSSIELDPTSSPEPTKFAQYVPPPSSTPSLTPTSTSTPTLTRTQTSTRIQTPTRTRTPTKVPTLAKPTATLSPTNEPVDVGEKYGTLSAAAVPNLVKAEFNLAVRGYAPSSSTLGLIDYTGPYDEGAPQLWRIFTDGRIPTWVSAYRVHNWDFSCNCRGDVVSDPPVTLVGMMVTTGEILRLPRSSYYIGQDHQALVLYADADRITLNYTRDASPIRGYTLYFEGIAVDSSLVGLYQRMDAAGRAALPAIQAGQGLGRARGNEIRIAIRDAGGFMDPRSRKDWWRGK